MELGLEGDLVVQLFDTGEKIFDWSLVRWKMCVWVREDDEAELVLY